MKALKRTGSFALAVLLVFALSTAALAEDGSADTLSQSVTIENLASGETVKVYRLISYAEGYNGYVTDAAFGAYLNGLAGADAKDPSKWASGSVDVTQLLEGYVAACSGGTRTLPAPCGEQTADGTSVTFTLTPGYYMMLVSTTLTSGKVYRPLSVFVKVTGEKSEVFGGGQNWALHAPAELTAKGEDAPKLDKMVKTAGSTWSKTGDAAVGDTVSFYLEVTVPRYTDVSDVSLAVEDTLTNLVYNGDAKLYDVVPDGSANEIAGAMTVTAANDGGKLTFTLDYAKLMAAGTMRTVYIGYTATVAASAAAGGNHSASNTAKLVYGNAAMPGKLLQTPSVATTVYNFSFALDKYFIDANDNLQPLDGAEFTFYTDAGCTNALTFTKVGDVYRPALAGETGVTAVPALVREPGVTGVTANLTICGLDAGTYYMKETKTPKGYAPPAGAYRMTLVPDGETGKLHSHDSSLTSASGTKADKDLIYHAHFSGSNLERLVISFLNTKLPALPSTGGIGTAVFTVGGVAVMVLAVVLLLCRKKKEN